MRWARTTTPGSGAGPTAWCSHPLGRPLVQRIAQIGQGRDRRVPVVAPVEDLAEPVGHPSFGAPFFRVESGGLPPGLAGQPFPEVWFSGSSDAAIASAGRHADLYLSWLEPFDALREKFARVRERTEAEGRRARVAVRVDVVARATEAEAWRAIARGWDNITPERADAWSARNRGDSVGGQRQAGFRPGDVSGWRDLIVAPNIWGGFSLLRGGPALGIVGDCAQAAERLQDLIDLGVDAFILAGIPHLEEAYRVGEEVLPLLGRETSAPAPAESPERLAVPV